MVEHDEVFLAKVVSQLLGWAYFFCWSVSFYPQPLSNWKRKSTAGLTVDFPLCNVLGFVAYSISCGAFLFSPTIRSQYAARHPVSPVPTVWFIDFLFAFHGMILCIITYSQFYPQLWGFRASGRQRVSRTVLGIFWGNILGVLAVLAIVHSHGGKDPLDWAWIDVIYAFGYVKMVVTVVKYCPQAWYNYKRQSTEGWHIGQILLDFSGGIFSLSQLIIDSSLQADWSGITGNPAKFGLSNISMAFDIIFMTQHYILYRHKDSGYDDNRHEHQSLLHSGSV